MGVQLGKFYFDSQWQPKKYNVEVEVPKEFTLSAYKNTDDPITADEELPDEAPVLVQVDESKVDMLSSMGFSKNASIRAIHATGDVQSGLDWIMSHMEDTDLHEPLYITPALPSRANRQSSSSM